MGHDLMFHTEGEVITAYGGLKEREEELKDKGFARCSASVLVNLRFVNGLFGDEVSVGSERIRIGRTRKKEFMASLNKYLGG
jgi:DNA-binding LytR/AlgR family response regulator